MAISVSSPLLLLSYYNIRRTGQTCKWSICPINQLQCLEKSSIIILQMFYPTFLTHSQLRTPTLKTFHSFNVCCLRMEKLEISKVILNNFSRTPPLVRPFCILTKFLYTRTKWLWSQRDVMHGHYIIPLTQVVWSLHLYSDTSLANPSGSQRNLIHPIYLLNADDIYLYVLGPTQEFLQITNFCQLLSKQKPLFGLCESVSGSPAEHKAALN